MAVKQLGPHLDLLREEYVLVQAWKKTAPLIRYHNWFSDTLELDQTAVNLRGFIDSIRERLQNWEIWETDPLRVVPAPKSKSWTLRNGKWQPEEPSDLTRLRPLAHVSLKDQVVATALVLCLANRIETIQHDPRASKRDQQSQSKVVSYGNRLFCDEIGGELRHRWGSSKLYRAYFQDYRTFIARPETAAKSFEELEGKDVYIVHADIKQFYDRVRPSILHEAIMSAQKDGDDPNFYSFLERALDWIWDRRDAKFVEPYAEESGLSDFTRVALPQGLVAAGFFANVALLAFDNALRDAVDSEIAPGIRLVDACRYVDDLRVVIAVNSRTEDDPEAHQEQVSKWLEKKLEDNASGLVLNPDKTKIISIGGDGRPRVRQIAKMNRIQSAVSGGFDALGGEEILENILGLLRSQEVYGESGKWKPSPEPDVRDVTVARFAAGRFRKTYRSIRPLLHSGESSNGSGLYDENAWPRVRSQRELDEEAQAFAHGLIQRWIYNPSNVRLLRIGLDLWPDADLVEELLNMLHSVVQDEDVQDYENRVAWYCLSEVLRAGATETGLVEDAESLPTAIDLEAYRDLLCTEAVRIIELPPEKIPWFLLQQALLFLAAYRPEQVPVELAAKQPEFGIYWDLIRFLNGDETNSKDSELATLAVLARRAFADRKRARDLTLPNLSAKLLQEIADRDPSFVLELLDTERGLAFVNELPVQLREDLCLTERESDSNTLANSVLKSHPEGRLRNELSLLRFAKCFLERLQEFESPPKVITPVGVILNIEGEDDIGICKVSDVQIIQRNGPPSGSLYEPPTWCADDEHWRIQLGFLLRFILSGQPDCTNFVRRAHWTESEKAYRRPSSSWFQRLYGLYSGQSAFGNDWLPITDWLEGFLLALLGWPGCRDLKTFAWVEQGIQIAIEQIQKRIAIIESHRGIASHSLILQMPARRRNTESNLRACVVQTVIPFEKHFKAFDKDLELNTSQTRQEHRGHLSAALAAVERLMVLRESHEGGRGELDWLILPELAVHPDDIWTHLVPFARAHRTIILTGLSYEVITEGRPPINSALWVIPEWSDTYGLQIRTRRQGKMHLAKNELSFNKNGKVRVRGFRPCQWLIGYPWSENGGANPLWLTASVCYDATDLALAADLRNKSDVLAIPALNRDVSTFDKMALALHYHMFQLVIVANNGTYGGSSAYWPKSKQYERQVFHMHGQPQAAISFIDIPNIGDFVRRKDALGSGANTNVTQEHRPGADTGWKYPPAGIKP